jgi:SAM-dependent methyltransferase
MNMDSTKRFSDRVGNYVKYRPAYPDEVVGFLERECNLSGNSTIADIGSGTGIFTGLLLNRGFSVNAVEPNADMQRAAVNQYGENENFIAVNGTAETTSLAGKSIDLIVCAQAFHWFNNEKARIEFNRILKNDGYAALIWNNRLTDADEFSVAYENLLTEGSYDYNRVNHRNIKDIDFKAFFRDGVYRFVKFPNEQVFDMKGYLGRVFSSSYVPLEGTQGAEKFKAELIDIFDKYNTGGHVKFQYQTEIYLGRV